MSAFGNMFHGTEVDLVVRRADGSVKQHLTQVDDIQGTITVLKDEKEVLVKKGGFLGGAESVLMVGTPLSRYKRMTKERNPYQVQGIGGGLLHRFARVARMFNGKRIPMLAFFAPKEIRALVAAGIVTKDGLGDAANLLVSDLAAATRFDSLAVGTGTTAAANTQVALVNEVPSGDASGMTRISGGTVTGSLVQTTVTGGKNANADTAQWVGTFSCTGTIGLWEVGVLNSASVPHGTVLTDNPLTSGATTITAVTTGFASSGDLQIGDNTTPEAVSYTGVGGGSSFTTVTRGKYGENVGTSHVQNTVIREILGDLLLRQVFASVLNLVNTDTLQATAKLANS